MRKLNQWMLFLAMAASAAPLHAATATEFYVSLLRRGVTEVEAGRNEAAVTPLRIAAFGLLDSVEHYQIAQAHLVIALDRMNQPDSAREAANRIVAAERIERKFASLSLSPSMRTAFAASAKKLLPAPDAALLLNAPPAQPAQQQQPQPQTSAKPTITEPPKKVDEKPKQVAESSSRQVVEKPAATTTPPSSTTRRLEDSKPPAPAPKPAQPAKPAVDVPARLAAGERALIAANLAEARKIYRELLDVPSLDHASAIRLAEGLYRSRDFAGALAAFQRVGNLRSGEEAYRYYIAVAAYETGQFDRARRELAAALPFIELTPDVQRYRARIESGR